MVATAQDTGTIWHPFTQLKGALQPLRFSRAKGATLFTEEGDAYLDGIASWWTILHGHCEPTIADAVHKQLSTLDHTLLAGVVHPQAEQLTERLLPLLPGNMSKLFFSDNGSTAVEVGIKMALQVWHNRDPNTTRKRLVAFRNSYHGDTFGAMSVAERGPFNRPFWDHLFPCTFIDAPTAGNEEASLAQMREALEGGDVAAFIFEPIIQGAGGMQIHSAEALEALLDLCREYEVMTIADEVMTAFGRTGPLFATERLNRPADIICMAKGITGGVLPLAVTACSEAIYEPFHSEDRMKALWHGHSYCGNPVGCAAALASLDLLLDPACGERRAAIERSHRDFLPTLQATTGVENAAVCGTILRLEVVGGHSEGYFSGIRDQLASHFVSQNCLLRPLGNVVYILPPYCIRPEELAKLYQVILSAVEEVA